MSLLAESGYSRFHHHLDHYKVYEDLRGSSVAEFGGLLFYGSNSGFWVTDGTTEGTTFLAPYGFSGDVQAFVPTPTGLVVVTHQEFWGPEGYKVVDQVWRTHGTLQSTQQLVSTAELSDISGLAHRDGALYFVATSTGWKRNLWHNDGNSLDLVQLTDAPNWVDFDVEKSTIWNQHFVFTFDDGVHGPEVWQSDGAPESTMLLKDIAPADLSKTAWAYPGPLFPFGDHLFFGAYDSTYGKELWQSDGTPDGTMLFKDIYPGRGSSSPDEFMGRAGVFFFTATDGVHGRELWQSDGTPDGTRIIADFYEGLASSTPHTQLIYDNTLLFTVDNGLDGRQLFGLYDPGIPLALPVGEEPPAALPHQYYMPLINR